MDNRTRKPRKMNFKLRKDKNGSKTVLPGKTPVKRGEDGLIVKYHNTANFNGNILRIRFVNGCFNHNSTKVVAIDHRGNVFIFDFVSKKIWKTFDKCKRSTTIQSNPYTLNEYLIGTKDGEVIGLDIEKGSVTRSQKFCLLPIKTISIPIKSSSFASPSAVPTLLIATTTEAILIDLKTFQANYKLEFDNANDIVNAYCNHTLLKFVSYFPNSERIFACFTNDSVHVWSTSYQSNDIGFNGNHNNTDCSDRENRSMNQNDIKINLNAHEETLKSKLTLKTLRSFYPLKIRDRQFRLKKSNKCIELKISEKIDYEHNFNNEAIDDTVNFLNKTVEENGIQDLSEGLINSFEFSLDGNYMCLTTLDKYILLMSTITLEMVQIIRTKDVCIQKCLCFQKSFYADSITLGNTSSNSHIQSTTFIAIALTSQSDIILIDFNDLLVKTVILGGETIYKMNLSNDGKLLLVILKTGEINIFRTSVAMNALVTAQKNINIIKRIDKKYDDDENFALSNELKKTLSKIRLLPILKEYGSYSNKYRNLIWTTLLDLPSNNESFTELLRKGLHPAVLKYDEEFPIKDVTLLRHLKRISSCLMYWSKILAECNYLPKFIFPFLKIFPSNSILTFELLVTILYNHCQLWFEFSPMEPLNYLGLIENALHHFDSELYKFYRDRNITTKVYAWTLLTTSFSEILDEQQWYQLWDNILTKDLEYIIFVVLAYQITQRNIIMRLESNESIEIFFHEQFIIDMQKFLKKANDLMESCPYDLNPRRYLKQFVSLPKGYYPKFENYPKEWLELKDKEMETMHLESAMLDEKIRNLEIEEIKLAKKLEEGLKDEEIQIRLKELEKLYCGAISREEERIACQRKMVLLCQKETRNHRRKVLEMVQNSVNRKNINLHENQLDTLMRNIERTRLRDETNMMLADEDLKDRELNLLSKICKIKSNSIVDSNKHFEYPQQKNIYCEDYDVDETNTIKNANVNRNKTNVSCSKDDNNSRIMISRTVTSDHKDSNSLAKEFQKRNNVIRKTYGVQLNTDCNPVVIDKKRTIQNNNNNNKNKKNYIDRIEGILDQIQMEFENIVNPEIGSS